MNRLVLTATAALIWGAMAGSSAVGQATTLEGVIGICTPVIDEQYNDERARDGQCIGAVSAYLESLGAPSTGADPQIAELVLALAELYREDSGCKISQTELPEAIQTAAAATSDAEIQVEYVAVAEQIDACDFQATAAINAAAATDA